MARAEALLEHVADLITDGVDVDWDRETPDEDSREILQPLRAIDAIATFHRNAMLGASGDIAQPTIGLTGATEAATGSIDSSPAPETWGRLLIRGRLGEGGFGDVYRAYDPHLHREVALKLLKRGTGASLLEEGRNLARVRHPNVLTVHGVDEHDGRVGLWMDLLEGTDLHDVVHLQGPMGSREAALVGIELCQALAAIHQADLLHCDVKPRNVRREKGGRIVLMDLGGARAGSDEQVGGPGTPHFLPPEVLEGAPWNVASDVYSLGVTLYWLVSGTYPVVARNLSELRERHRSGEVVALRDVRADLPAPFVRVVERAIDADPARRYATAGAMERDLADSLEVSGDVEDAAAARPQRTMWPWMAAAVGTLLVAGLTASLLRSGQTLTAEAAMFSDRGGVGDREVGPEELIPPGGRLYVTIRGDEEMFVYALNEDSAGEFNVLFPLTESAAPLAAGTVHRLPGPEQAWEVDSEGGRERIVVIAARKRLADLERHIVDAPRAVPEGDRGVGTVVQTGAPPRDTRLGEIADLLLHQDGRSGVRTWEFAFRSSQE